MHTHTETPLHSTTLYSGKIIRLRRDEVRLENGHTTTREVVEHNGGIAVAALTDRDELLMVRQLRYPYGKELLEVPAGKREGTEDPLLGGQRELREETGAVGRDYRFLGEIYPTPGYCSEIIWLYACRVDTIGANAPDPDEFLDVARIPLDTAEQMVLRGEIPDAKTQIAVLKVAALHRAGRL